MRRFVLLVALLLASPAVARIKQSSTINVSENTELSAGVGDVMVRVNLRESLPNAFGGADIFGRKRDRGFVEIRFMGIAPDGRAIFRRRSIDIYSNETTMSRSGLRYGSANAYANGNSAQLSGYSVGAQPATVEPLPPDTIETALDLSKYRTITIEDRQVEIRSADEGSVRFVVVSR